eukprot:scaffold45218_cov61-Phaeocystis_antarctica.AAC.10
MHTPGTCHAHAHAMHMHIPCTHHAHAMHTPCTCHTTCLPIDRLIEAREAQLEEGKGQQLRGVAALAP